MLDSTELRRAHCNLQDADLQALFAAQRGLDVRLAVPEVVLRECLNAIGEEATACAAKADKELHAYARWTGVDVSGLRATRLAADVGAARTRLEHGLRDEGVRILPIPDIGHGDLVARDLARTKPFDAGRGYRDALIWETVLALAAEEPVPVVFVTANRQDFGDGQLHPHLSQDVATRGWSRGRVLLAASAKVCWELYLRQQTQPLKESYGGDVATLLTPDHLASVRQAIRLSLATGQNELRIFPATAERERCALETILPEPRLGPVRSATRFPDGTLLVSCPGTFHAIVWSTKRNRDASFTTSHWEAEGSLSVRIVVPPDAAPHVKVDDFAIGGQVGFTPEGEAYMQGLYDRWREGDSPDYERFWYEGADPDAYE